MEFILWIYTLLSPFHAAANLGSYIGLNSLGPEKPGIRSSWCFLWLELATYTFAHKKAYNPLEKISIVQLFILGAIALGFDWLILMLKIFCRQWASHEQKDREGEKGFRALLICEEFLWEKSSFHKHNITEKLLLYYFRLISIIA